MSTPLDTFIEITQWAGTRDEAASYLEAAAGNVETAISLLFESPPSQRRPQTDRNRSNTAEVGNSSGRRGRQQGAAPRSLVAELNDAYSRDLVKNPAPRVSPQPPAYEIHLPFLALITYPIGKLLGLLLPLIPSWLRQAPTGVSPFLTYVVPFLAPFVSDSGEGMPSTLLEMTYNAALERAKGELKYLLVVLTSEVHEYSAAQYIKHFLATLLWRRDDVYVWFGSVTTSEGYRVADSLGADRYPCVALIAASPKTAQSSVLVMERLLLHSGELTEEFLKSIPAAIEDHEPRLVALRLERSQFDADRQIRQEQDSAYKRSLEADRKKAQEAEERRAKEVKAQKLEKAWLTRIFKRADLYGDDENKVGGARISVRLPDGRRETLSVPGDRPVSDIYDVVYARLYPERRVSLDTETEQADRVAGDLSGLEPHHDFTLMSTVLRHALPYSNETLVKDEPAVWPSGVLMVDLE